MLVNDLGYAEASERLNVKPATLRKWAERDQWNIVPRHASSVVTNVTTVANAHADALSDDSQATRIGFSRASRKVAERASSLPADELMDKETAQAAKHWHGIASGTHGWEAKQEAPAVLVNIALLGVPATPAPRLPDIEGDVTEAG